MESHDLIERISLKGSDKEKIASEVIRKPELIVPLMDVIKTEKDSITLRYPVPLW